MWRLHCLSFAAASLDAQARLPQHQVAERLPQEFPMLCVLWLDAEVKMWQKHCSALVAVFSGAPNADRLAIPESNECAMVASVESSRLLRSSECSQIPASALCTWR